MGAIPEKIETSRKSESSKKSIFMVIGILCAIAAVGVTYMFWVVAPEEVSEMVRVVAVRRATSTSG